jgi:phosphate uptake regulator
MESRKIQTVGGGTYTVSLPKAWADDQGLEAGSVVDVHTHVDGVLVVEARDPADSLDRVAVRVDDQSPAHLERTLRAAYAAGVSTVVFEATGEFTDAQIRRLESTARTLTGVTVGERTPTRVAVQTLVDAGEVSITQSVRQLSFVALSMHRDATAALVADGEPDAVGRDDQADRLAAIVDRHFVRALTRLDEVDALGQGRPELLDCWTTARELERVADHAERITTTAAAVDHPTADAVDALIDLAERARAVVDGAVRGVLDGGEAATARDALEGRDRVRERATAIERRHFEASETDYRLVRILDSISETAEHGGNVAEAALRRAARRDELTGLTLPDGDEGPVDAATEAGE